MFAFLGNATFYTENALVYQISYLFAINNRNSGQPSFVSSVFSQLANCLLVYCYRKL